MTAHFYILAKYGHKNVSSKTTERVKENDEQRAKENDNNNNKTSFCIHKSFHSLCVVHDFIIIFFSEQTLGVYMCICAIETFSTLFDGREVEKDADFYFFVRFIVCSFVVINFKFLSCVEQCGKLYFAF